MEVGPDIPRGGAGIHRSTCEYLIKDERDLEAFCRYIPGLDAETVADMETYTKHALDYLGDNGIFVPWG